jgi:hypothetical protein
MAVNKSEKAGRVQVTFALPDYVYWKIKKRIGDGNVNALMKIFAMQFAQGKAGLHIEFEPTAEDLKKVA